jgi:hypothetical protein
MLVDCVQDQLGQEASGRFRDGRSGNPSGRPTGIRNKVARAAETSDFEKRLPELEEAHAASA